MPRLWTTIRMPCGAIKENAPGASGEVWARLHQRSCATCEGRPYEVQTEREGYTDSSAARADPDVRNIHAAVAIAAARNSITSVVRARTAKS
jgi:hypothetical protein